MVKVAGRDVLATWKVLVSLGIAPFLFGFYAFLATMLMVRANAPMSWRIWTPVMVMVTLPFLGYAALKFGEAGMDVLKCVLPLAFHMFTLNFEFQTRSLRPLVIALIPGQQRTLDKVKDVREKLTNELTDVINEYGPEVFEDFNEVSTVPAECQDYSYIESSSSASWYHPLAYPLRADSKASGVARVATVPSMPRVTYSSIRWCVFSAL